MKFYSPAQLDLSCIYDFYSLYAMKTELETVTPGIHKKIDVLLADVDRDFNSLVAALHPALGQYLYLASFAEARHAEGRCDYRIKDIVSHGWSREQASKAAVNFNPVTTTAKLQVLFYHPWRSSGFGGKKWGDIAQASYRYFTNQLPPVVFIDHVVSIQHNGGMAFSKGTSAGLVKLKLQWGNANLTGYLNVRAGNKDILDPKSDSEIKNAIASMRTSTIQLLRRHWIIFRENDYCSKWIDAILANYRRDHSELYGFPEPYILEFGDQETSEPENVYVSAINEPYAPSPQFTSIGAYNEFVQQSAETDRDGNAMEKPVISEPVPVQGMSQGKYFAFDINGW